MKGHIDPGSGTGAIVPRYVPILITGQTLGIGIVHTI
jgi:hypothetical protein